MDHFRVAVNLTMTARLSAKLFRWKLVLFAYEWKLNFHSKNFALSLAFTMRFKATRKWSIEKITLNYRNILPQYQMHQGKIRNFGCPWPLLQKEKITSYTPSGQLNKHHRTPGEGLIRKGEYEDLYFFSMLHYIQIYTSPVSMYNQHRKNEKTCRLLKAPVLGFHLIQLRGNHRDRNDK